MLIWGSFARPLTPERSDGEQAPDSDLSSEALTEEGVNATSSEPLSLLEEESFTIYEN